MKFLKHVKDDTWLPYLMPWVWHWTLGIAFSGGVLIGAGIAIYMLKIRGLL